MANNQVSVEITLEEKAALRALTQLTRNVQKTEDGFTKMGKKGEESLGALGRAGEGVSNGFKSLVGGVTIANLASSAIIGTANAIKDFVFGSINAAIEQENAINRLGAALKRTGEFTSDAMGDFQAFASELQQNSTFGDEVILGQLAIAKSYGLTNDRAKQLVAAATELSATFGTSLDTNIKNLGKSFAGLTGELGEALPIIKTLTAEQLKAGGAIDLVNSKFAGAAKAELDTYQGGVTGLSNAYSDLQEGLGAFITGSQTVSAVMGTTKSLFEQATQALIDYRTEQARGENGFQETQDSVNQLSREYESLTEKIETLESKNLTLPGGPDAFDTSRIKVFRNELASLEQQIKNAQTEVFVNNKKDEIAAAENGPSGSGEMSAADKKLVQSREAAYAQLEIVQAEYNARQVEASVLATELTEENYAFELERLMSAEQMKIDALFAAEEQKALLIEDSKTMQYALQKIAIDKEAALDKSSIDTKKKVSTAQIALEQQKQAAMIGIVGSSFALASALAKDGSKEQFMIQKGAAIAEIAIARGKAIALIPAQTAHIPFPGNLPAAATLMTYANVQAALGLATVAASAIKGYEQGGIVGGNSMTGDNIMARVNSGEMILNRQQQTGLFNQINNGGSGANDEILKLILQAIKEQPVTVSLDGREIARSLRNVVQSGFKLA